MHFSCDEEMMEQLLQVARYSTWCIITDRREITTMFTANKKRDELTRDKVIAIATKVAKERYSMTLEQFIDAVKDNRLDDPCEIMEVAGLLSLLPEYEDVLTAA